MMKSDDFCVCLHIYIFVLYCVVVYFTVSISSILYIRRRRFFFVSSAVYRIITNTYL